MGREGRSEEHGYIHTYDPFVTLPRFTEYYRSTVTRNYYSCGNFRKNENHCIFHYTLRGSGETWIHDQRYRTAPGIGFLNIINDEEAGYRHPEDSEEEWEFFVLCFDYGNSRDIVKELIDTYGPLYALPTEFMQQLQNRFSLHPDSILSKSESYSVFSSLISQLIFNAENYHSVSASSLIQNTKNLITQNITKAITIQMLAEKLNLSREHLSRSFYKYTGSSLKSYITKQQINYICGLLKNTDMTITEISLTMNFSSSSNFTLFFKRQTDFTPKQFRKYGSYPV